MAELARFVWTKSKYSSILSQEASRLRQFSTNKQTKHMEEDNLKGKLLKLKHFVKY